MKNWKHEIEMSNAYNQKTGEKYTSYYHWITDGEKKICLLHDIDSLTKDNARLIAAAPSMLEVLEDSMSCIQSPVVRETIKNLIAEIKGGS